MIAIIVIITLQFGGLIALITRDPHHKGNLRLYVPWGSR